MAKAKDNIKDIIRIHEFEEQNAHTVIQPRDTSDSLPAFQKYQLILTKLYVGNDICAAIYVNSRGQTLISNNTGDRTNVDLVNNILTEFSENSIDSESAKSKLTTLLKDNQSYRLPAERETAIIRNKSSSNSRSFKINKLLKRDINTIIDHFDTFGRQLLEPQPIFIDTGNTRHIHAEMKWTT